MHQDWDLDGQEWPDLVRNFVQGLPAAELNATADELAWLMADLSNDRDLTDRVYGELGCYYDPRPDQGGPGIRAWLGRVAELLRRLAAAA